MSLRERVARIIADSHVTRYAAGTTMGGATPTTGDLKATDRILALLAESESWRPIETAPKDGTVILAWRFFPVAMKWTGASEYPWEAVHLGGSLDLRYDGFVEHDLSLTHWMPLPARPQHTERDDGE